MTTPDRSLHPLNPLLHAAYTPVVGWHPSEGNDPLPAEVRSRVRELLVGRGAAPEDLLDAIDREIVSLTWWYALRPDEIARATIAWQRLPSRVLSIEQATIVLAALGEAGYPLGGNSAPDYERTSYDAPDPVRGPERDGVIWAAARHWAEMASRHATYVSLGDSRGFCPRAVQYDQPGSMHPGQQAALTFGPASDRGDECNSHGYMRRHTRRLLLVRSEVQS